MSALFLVRDAALAQRVTAMMAGHGYAPISVNADTDWGRLAVDLAGAPHGELASALECVWLSGRLDARAERRRGRTLPDDVTNALGVPERTQFALDVEEERTVVHVWVELDGESIARDLYIPQPGDGRGWAARVARELEVCLATVVGVDVEAIDDDECRRIAEMAFDAAEPELVEAFDAAS